MLPGRPVVARQMVPLEAGQVDGIEAIATALLLTQEAAVALIGV
jgi:hypothetical protein